MTPEPCPTCKGNCCRDVDYGHHRTHRDKDDVYIHDCPDCDEGKASPPFAWTDVDEEYRMAPGYAKTQRAPVPGGYLYRIVHYTDSGEVCSFGGLAFVPARWHL